MVCLVGVCFERAVCSVQSFLVVAWVMGSCSRLSCVYLEHMLAISQPDKQFVKLMVCANYYNIRMQFDADINNRAYPILASIEST